MPILSDDFGLVYEKIYSFKTVSHLTANKIYCRKAYEFSSLTAITWLLRKKAQISPQAKFAQKRI